MFESVQFLGTHMNTYPRSKLDIESSVVRYCDCKCYLSRSSDNAYLQKFNTTQQSRFQIATVWFTTNDYTQHPSSSHVPLKSWHSKRFLINYVIDWITINIWDTIKLQNAIEIRPTILQATARV